MTTPEQIAREAAEKAVRVEVDEVSELGNAHGKLIVAGIPSKPRWWAGEDPSRAYVNAMTPLFLAAIEEALHQCPVPSPVSEEVLKYIRMANSDRASDWKSDAATANIDALFQHIDHLTRIFGGPEAEAFQAMYELGKLHGHMAGWREGAEAQQEMVRDSLRKAGYLTAEELVRLSGIVLHAQEVTDE